VGQRGTKVNAAPRWGPPEKHARLESLTGLGAFDSASVKQEEFAGIRRRRNGTLARAHTTSKKRQKEAARVEKLQEKAAKRLQKKAENADRIPGSGPEIETRPIEAFTLPEEER